MCLILFAVDQHDEYHLVLAANRDEFYERPSAPAAFWDEAPNVVGGRDLAKGGSWLGIDRSGRWCAVTNYRDGRHAVHAGRSRGSLVREYLVRTQHPFAYASGLPGAEPMAGYSIVLGNGSDAYYASNRGAPARKLCAGIYGLSNHLLDTPWPKVRRGKAAIARVLSGPARTMRDDLFGLLQDRSLASDDELPDTGVGNSLEKVLSPAFIQSPGYGTRCSSVLLISRNGRVLFEERAFGEHNEAMPFRRYEFSAVLRADRGPIASRDE